MRAHVSDVEIATVDGSCDGWMAAPSGDGPWPGVLFYMDAFGLRPVIADWIKRIAFRGYVVLAPNVFYRSSRTPVVDNLSELMAPENRPKLFEQLRPMMALLTPERVVEDAGAYLRFLREQPECGNGAVGATGYCMGAAMAFRTAAAFPHDIGALASFHGGNLATDAESSPHLLADRIAAAIYVAHADEDQSAPPEQQAKLAAAFRDKDFAAELYPGARHGFTMADTAAYDEAAAERHFEKLMGLFDRVLKG